MRTPYYGSFNKEEAEGSTMVFFLSILGGIVLCFLGIYFHYTLKNGIATFISLSGGMLILIVGLSAMRNEREAT